MLKLKIVAKSQYDYTLEDSNHNQYFLNIEFYDMEEPSVDDYLYISEKLLKEEQVYSFGPINDKNRDESEFIKLVRHNQEFYLERYYG
jgi:RNase P/RNase MRP subunit p30